MAARTTGEERNTKGECYMTPCGRKAFKEITYYGKKVMVCRKHVLHDNAG